MIKGVAQNHHEIFNKTGYILKPRYIVNNNNNNNNNNNDNNNNNNSKS